MQLPVYLDHAATTPVAAEVVAAMLPYFDRVFANPATLYTPGAIAREAVDGARAQIAAALGAQPEEIYFTSGGTEANNWAIKGLALTAPTGKRHMLTTSIEHHAVLHPARAIARQGYNVEYVPVDGDGLVDPDDVVGRIRPDTFLVSVMHANNEVGTIQPIEEIARACAERGVPFHTDMVQTFGKWPIIDVGRTAIDLASLSAHKLYGPKGIGALYIRRGIKIAPLLDGGEQERGYRAGTLNVPSIVGLGEAVRLALPNSAAEARRLEYLRDLMIDLIVDRVPQIWLNGSRSLRLPNNVHISVGGVEGEALLLALDMAGICASAGSACSSGSTEPSHVLLAMGLPVEIARGALRLTLGRDSTEEAVRYTVERLAEIVKELRTLSGEFE